ncbi:hypothetical protein N665_2883s0004, partial [Sinapis alba]
MFIYIHGGKIHASVKRELVALFDPFLRQGYSLMLIKFSVTHSCSSYITTNHAYRISYLSTTRVRSCEQLPEDLVGFEPVKYKEVLDGTLNPNYLVDIIGQIVEISHIEHVYINENLPKDDLPLAIVEFKYSAIVNGFSDKDDFFIHTPRKTIAQILETKQKCIMLWTIIAIDSDMGWFYLRCKEDDVKHTYYCVKCKTYNPVNLPSNTKLLVFNNHAMQLLNQPCLQIAGPSNKFEIEETNVLPPALNIIIGKTFLFKIQIERENFVYKHKIYNVLKVITNKDLISDIEEGNSPN